MFSFIGRPRGHARILTTLLTSAAIIAPAQAQEQQKPFDIPTQTLSTALLEFSRQSNQLVVADPTVVNGRAAPAVKGAFTPREALDRLLTGSGLTVTEQQGQGFVVAASPTLPGAAAATGSNISASDEIIVTARKREESLQDVPSSLTALSGRALERIGAEGFEDFVRLAPGLAMNPTSTNPNFSIRGISTSTTLGTTQAPIALYIDETPTQDPFVALSSFNLHLADINRVEVLRGPQGTLFGSGSLSGAIRVITNKPDPSGFSGYVEGGLSTIEGGETGRQLEAMINAPLGDRAAFRVVAYNRETGGYIDNPTRGVKNANDQSVTGGRAALSLDLTDSFEVTATILHQSDDGDDGARTFYTPAQGGSDEWSSLQADDTHFDVDIGNLLATWSLSGATITSSTSYMEREEHTHLDASPDLSPLLGVPNTPVFSDNDNTSENFVQELRLASAASGPFSYVLGAYYSNAERHTHTFVRAPALESLIAIPYALQADLNTKIEEAALFGELNWAVTPTLEVAAGARIFRNEVNVVVDNDGLLIGGAVNLDRTNTEEDVTPRFTARWKPQDNLTFYAQAAKGYRLGQANVAAGPPIYGSDTLWNYEIGMKGRFFDDRWTLNLAAFDIEWDNLQVGLRPPASVLLYTGNAGAARSIGLEAESVFKLSQSFEFSTSLSLTNAELTESIPNLPQPSGALGVSDGERLPGTPQFAIASALSYDRSFSDTGAVHIRIDYQYVGQSYNTFTESSALEMGDYHVFNLSAGLDLGQTSINLFVKNIGDSDGVTNANFDLGLDTIRAAWRLQPRSIGIVLRQGF